MDASDDPEAVERFAGRMQIEATRLTNLVQELIDLSRVQNDDPLEDAEPVGTVTLHHEGGRSHIVDLAVVAERRRRGIASAVLTGLLASDRRLTVTVWERNHGAQRLYERHGFAVVAEQFGYLLMATEADR